MSPPSDCGAAQKNATAAMASAAARASVIPSFPITCLRIILFRV